jgi:HEAT repeat protein
LADLKSRSNMSHNRSARLFGTMSCLCVAVVAIGQKGALDKSSRGKTSAEELTALGINLSEPSLLNALSNTNPRVRMLAAYQLEDSQYVDSTAAIEHALSVEKDPMTRVGIATALAGLHDPQGIEHLQTMCADTAVPIRAVIAAAQMLQILNSSNIGCTDTFLKSLTNDREKDYRDVTLSLLPALYRESTPEQSNLIVTAIQKLLRDRTQEPAVRMAAGDALAEIGLPSSSEVIREAVSQEADSTVRASLESNLNALEKKP